MLTRDPEQELSRFLERRWDGLLEHVERPVTGEDSSPSYTAGEHIWVCQPVDRLGGIATVSPCPRVRGPCVQTMDGDDVDVRVRAPVNRVDLNQPSGAFVSAHIGAHDQEGTPDSRRTECVGAGGM